MKIIRLKSQLEKEELYSIISDYEKVNEGVLFDEKRGKPIMRVSRKGHRVRIVCNYVGGTNKDNGFLVGTYFVGKLKENATGSTLTGIILTAPLYHLFLLGIMVFYVYKCISLGGFNPVPPMMLVFSIFLFWGEFKKQGIIKRYLFRALRKAMREKYGE